MRGGCFEYMRIVQTTSDTEFGRYWPLAGAWDLIALLIEGVVRLFSNFIPLGTPRRMRFRYTVQASDSRQ